MTRPRYRVRLGIIGMILASALLWLAAAALLFILAFVLGNL